MSDVMSRLWGYSSVYHNKTCIKINKHCFILVIFLWFEYDIEIDALNANFSRLLALQLKWSYRNYCQFIQQSQ